MATKFRSEARVIGDELGAATDSYPIDGVPDLRSDTVDLPVALKAIRAKIAGDIVCITAAGNQRTIAIAAAETRKIRITRVFATGTTATGLEGLT